MNDLISREEAQKALYGCVMPNQHAEDILAEVPSADIIEHARAIKKYCKDRMECAKCRFNIECNGRSVCRLYMNLPIWWDLPEGDAE